MTGQQTEALPADRSKTHRQIRSGQRAASLFQNSAMMMKVKSQANGRARPLESKSLSTTLPWDPTSQQTHILLKRKKIGQILHLFCSGRRRLGLTPDEILIFFAIGYLSASTSDNLIIMNPTSYAEVALLLGIPRETVRRKTIRLVDLEYVGATSKGIFIRELDNWCQMFEGIV